MEREGVTKVRVEENEVKSEPNRGRKQASARGSNVLYGIIVVLRGDFAMETGK